MILCCGEALIDFVPLNGCSGYRPLPGGSIFNTAISLGRLDVPCGLFTRLSTDFFGRQLTKSLTENGVDTRYLLHADAPTTLAFVSIDAGRSSEPEYLFYANGTADRGLKVGDLPAVLPDEVGCLHFGSISLVLEPAASSLEFLMKRESGRRIISLDPNIRPGLIPDRDAYLSRFESWLELVDILRLSRSDFDWLYPDADIEEKMHGWLEIGACLCLLTDGAAGVRAIGSNGLKIQVAAPNVNIADTVGAGDSFTGAFLASLYRHGLAG